LTSPYTIGKTACSKLAALSAGLDRRLIMDFVLAGVALKLLPALWFILFNKVVTLTC